MGAEEGDGEEKKVGREEVDLKRETRKRKEGM